MIESQRPVSNRSGRSAIAAAGQQLQLPSGRIKKQERATRKPSGPRNTLWLSVRAIHEYRRERLRFFSKAHPGWNCNDFLTGAFLLRAWSGAGCPTGHFTNATARCAASAALRGLRPCRGVRSTAE